MVERTEDGKFIVIEGRRWRASDPYLPDPTRHALISELMSARRAVRSASEAGDFEGEQEARHRVHEAKVALGERGLPWWEPGGVLSDRQDVIERVLARVEQST